MIDLKNVTFIIPIRIESEDRKTNTLLSINYLCKYLETNIIILENDNSQKIPEILNNIDIGNSLITYIFLKNETGEIFHRTKFLNMMLNKVSTPIVVNYDVDVLLKPHVYLKCRDLILAGQDLVYPYFWGNSQYQVFYSGRDKIYSTYDLNSLIESDVNLTRSEYGHCQFFNTKKYISGGMENEGFVSYAPEDQERGYRFKKLGYNVMWADEYVYHLEHTRGINSSSANPMMNKNNKLFDFIKTLSKEELFEYYKKIKL